MEGGEGKAGEGEKGSTRRVRWLCASVQGWMLRVCICVCVCVCVCACACVCACRCRTQCLQLHDQSASRLNKAFEAEKRFLVDNCQRQTTALRWAALGTRASCSPPNSGVLLHDQG